MVIVGVVLALVVLTILLLPYLLDLNRYRDQYVPVLEKALHRNVEVEDVRLTLFPLGLQLSQVVVADDPGFSSKPFLTVPSVQMIVQWRPLLQRRVQVDNVVVENLRMQVIRSAKGDLNISTLGNVSPSDHISEQQSQVKKSVSPLLGFLALEQISLTGGTLQFEDRAHPMTKIHQIKNLVLNTESVAMGETAHIRMKGMLTPYQTPIDVTGEFGPLQPNFDLPELELQAHVGKIGVTANGKIVNGLLTADIQVPNASADDVPIELGLRQPVAVSQVKAHLVASIFPQSSQASSGELIIDSLRLNLHLGQSTIQVSGNGTPSRFSLSGTGPSLSSEDFPVVLPVHQPVSLEQLKIEAEVQDDKWYLHSLKAKAFDGALFAQGVLDSLRPPLTFSTQGSFKDFSTESVMKVLRPSSLSIAGVGELKWKVSGVVLPSTRPEFDGPAHLTIRDGEIIGFDLVEVVENSLKLSGILGKSTGTTQFSRIEAMTEFNKDRVAIRDFTGMASSFSVRGKGKVGMNESVNIQGTFSVVPAIAEKIVQRFPLAKTVRQEGRLMLPFVVRGTVQDVKFRLDTQSLGSQVQKKLQKRFEKVLKGDDQELKKLLDEGKDFLKHFFQK